MTERKDTLSRVKRAGIIPVLRTSESDKAISAAVAIHRGGIPVIEISMAMPGALHVLEAVAKAHGSDMLVGAGTVVDGEGVCLAAAAGAQFIVTPGFNSDAVEKAAELAVAIFVGALTPTEVQIASASEADAIKLFPCYAVGGPRYLRSLRGQYPHAELIASGGVSLDNCPDYFRAGACAIGVGGEIADAESMALGNYRVFTVRARRFLEAVHEARAFGDDTPSADHRAQPAER